ncbi:recombinase family protein [Streptomyces sp. TRM75561]|uniref:recombinase family protein n=1 Tax=Streptomyces sp. TRM75561 TaxID=2975269 RepID=UPI00244CE591|nr:recombinase family protein [Streptomyces sp. TRM75561]MDH3039227.1 recombinase family protein [Streptomyces sp. TRM75561]
MDLTPDQAAIAVERSDCPNCEAPAGSPCRTRGGKTATKYHTPRFILVPALREELEVLVPEDREPGRPWKPGPPAEAAPAELAAKPIRIGYARCSTAQQELASQLDALARAKCKRVFSEKISTRVKTRPKLEEALKLACDIREAAPDQEVILTVHELKRLARNAVELMTLSGQLQGAGVQLELLTGPLTGIYNPNGMGAMFFAVLAAAAQNAGKNPSVASLFRALAEAEQTEAPAGPEIIAPRRPRRVDLTGSGSGTDPELMEHLQHQVLGGTDDDVLHTLVEQTEDQTNDVVAALLAQVRREGEDA